MILFAYYKNRLRSAVVLCSVVFSLLCLNSTASDFLGQNYTIDFDPDNSRNFDLGEGYTVDLMSRKVSFYSEDLKVEGNAKKLPIVISRVLEVNRRAPGLKLPFTLGNWDLEVPRITANRGLKRSDGTKFSIGDGPEVWSSGYCNNPVFTQGTGDAKVDLYFWNGLSLDIPQKGTQELLFAMQDQAGEAQVVYPNINVIDGIKGAATYRSTLNWKADCLDLPQGNRSGFTVSSPEGLKYTFDKFAAPKSKVNELNNWNDTLGLAIYASKIEDPYGNYLNYEYEKGPNGNLYVSSIISNDGRKVTFEYKEVDLSEHVWWTPVNKVKYLDKVHQYGNSGTQIVKTISYEYSNEPIMPMYRDRYDWYDYDAGEYKVLDLTGKFNDGTYSYSYNYYPAKGVLSKVIFNDGEHVEYKYRDFAKTAEKIWRTDPNQGYDEENAGTEFMFVTCDEQFQIDAGWVNIPYYCSPDYSTIPAMLEQIRRSRTDNHNYFFYEPKALDEIINTRVSAGSSPYYWAIKSLGGFNNEDEYIDYYKFSTTINSSDDKEIPTTITTRVEFPDDNRVEDHTFWTSQVTSSTKARFKNYFGGFLKDYKVYTKQNESLNELESVSLDWLIGNQIGDNSSKCWIEECDKPNVWQIFLQKKTAHLDGYEFVTEYSQYDDFGYPKKVKSISQSLGGENLWENEFSYVYSHLQNQWIIGLLEETRTPSGKLITGNTYYNNGSIKSKLERGAIDYFEYHADGTLKNEYWLDDHGTKHNHSYTNYVRGIAQEETFPNSATINRTVNDYGLISEENDAKSYTHRYRYDSIGRLIFTERPEFSDLTYDLSKSGLNRDVVTRPFYLKEVNKTPKGSVISEIERIGLGNSDRDNIIKSHEYDAMGRPSFISNPYYNSQKKTGQEIEYDALGRVVKTKERDHSYYSTYCYGVQCNTGREGKPKVKFGILVTDEDGYETIYNYRSANGYDDKVVSEIIREISKSPAEYQTINIEYNEINQKTKITSGSFYREYIYNDFFQLEKEINPEFSNIEYKYNNGGLVSQKKIGTEHIDFSYNGLKKVTSAIYSDGKTPSKIISYDAAGNIENITFGEIKKSYVYNSLNQATKQTTTIEGQEFITEFSYSDDGFLNRIKYPSGNSVYYYPDELGRRTRVKHTRSSKDLASDIQYHPNNKVESFTYGNGINYKLSYNSRSLPLNLTMEASEDYFVDQSFTYDGRKNFIEIINNINSGFSKNITVDGLSRLKSASGIWGNVNFKYDTSGNLLEKTVGNSTVKFNYNQNNQLSSLSDGSSFSYDDKGNMTSAYDQIRDFNLENQLIRNQSKELGVDYKYDGDGLRVLTNHERDGLNHTIYNPNGDILFTIGDTIYDDSTEFVHLGDQVIARILCKTTDTDYDGDSIPGCIERRWGGDDSNPYDVNSDPDNDGIKTRDEFINRTSPISNIDNDQDGLPDDWEIAYGFDTNNPNDALNDADGDGLSNLEEYQNGWDPRVAGGASDYSYAWTTLITGSGLKVIGDIEADSDGNLYVLGSSQDILVKDSKGSIESKSSSSRYEIFVIKINTSGEIEWIQRVPKTYYDDYASGIALAEDGNLYVFADVSVQSSIRDLALFKFNPNTGKLLNKHIFGGDYEQFSSAMFIRNSSIYIAGQFDESITFDESTNVIGSNSGRSGFIAKYDLNFNLEWQNVIYTEDDVSISEIEVDNAGNIYVAGGYYSDVEFDKRNTYSGKSYFITEPFNGVVAIENGYIAKYLPNGDVSWVHNFPAGRGSIIKTIDIDINDQLTLGGQFNQNGFTGLGVEFGSFMALKSEGATDSFILKLSLDGNYLNHFQFGGSYEQYIQSLDTSVFSKLAIGGSFEGQVDFDSGVGVDFEKSVDYRLGDPSLDAFLTVSNSPDLEWRFSMGGIGTDEVKKIKFSENGDLYSLGSYYYTVDVNPTSEVNNQTSSGFADIFITKHAIRSGMQQ
ncbi:hypothetical protein [Microbulbifer epialgicus]|uniref:RHS repeat-associated core domain-containing protein n=1 Tax=Microbulbifer epialgicus TaxID=393907 RepID=A0ABV4NVZ8_9GAMM